MAGVPLLRFRTDDVPLLSPQNMTALLGPHFECSIESLQAHGKLYWAVNTVLRNSYRTDQPSPPGIFLNECLETTKTGTIVFGDIRNLPDDTIARIMIFLNPKSTLRFATVSRFCQSIVDNPRISFEIWMSHLHAMAYVRDRHFSCIEKSASHKGDKNDKPTTNSTHCTHVK